ARLAALAALAAPGVLAQRMAIGVAARDHQAGAEWIGRRRRHSARTARAAALQLAAPADARAVHAIAFQRAKARRQRTVVRARLAHPSAVGIVVVAQQAKLHHQGGDQLGVELFPAATAQCTRQYQIAETGTDQSADGDPHGFEHATDFAVAAFLESDAIPAVAAVAAQ